MDREGTHQAGGRKRKAPRNTEWRGDTLHGRIRIKGTLRRWSLRTGDVDVARARVAEDIARLKAVSDGTRIRYADIAASWAEQHIMHEVSARTAQRYAVSLRQLEPWLLDLDLAEIDKAKIDEIVTARRAAGASTATIRRDLTALSSVLGFAEVGENHARLRSQKLKERRDPIALPEAAHVDQVIQRAPQSLKALIKTARWTGCRLEELVTAKRSGFDRVRHTLTVRGKGNKTRVIALNGAAYEILCGLVPRLGCDVLFWHGHGKILRNVSSRFAAITRSLEAAGKIRRFRFHDLRHLYAVEALKAGMSIYDVQQQLGHASIKVTEWYLTFLTPEEKRAAMYGAREAAEQRGK